jgi:hypothetical protein
MLHIKDWAKENGLGGVDVVIEAGQPNAGYVVDLIRNLMIDDPDSGIASVGVARKQDHVPLQTADFLSHVYATPDYYWSQQLAGIGNVFGVRMTQELLINSSNRVKSLIAKRRKMRKEARKKERGSPEEPK